ncbi:MAG: DUF5615 family PIN-like protein [Bacteroidetes bacterium]|nr:DUF5615 family PIN-like protein [Bacteroidota bacterium]MBX7045321.1 DUF5615 family PIN-like protein [Ignavibacteria bacterium]
MDENLPVDFIDYLKKLNLNIKDIKSENLFGINDVEVLKISNDESRVIITQDKDFGKIVYTNLYNFFGIIYLKPGHISSKIHIDTFQHLLNSDLILKTPFIVVAENNNSVIKIRLRNELKF